MILLSNSRLILEGETKQFFQNMELISKEGIHPPGALQFFYELKKAGKVSGELPIALTEASQQLKQLFS
jgi:hypothetical protein